MGYFRPLTSLFLCAAACFLTASAVTAQQTQTVDPISCSGWDESFISLFHVVWLVILAGSLIGGLVGATLLGGWFWLWTRPLLRIVVAAVTITLLLAGLFWLWPTLFGFGSGILDKIPPEYARCSGHGRDFGATGVFNGLFGSKIAAVDLSLGMFFLNFIAGVVGLGGALLLNKLLFLLFGLKPSSKGGA